MKKLVEIFVLLTIFSLPFYIIRFQIFQIPFTLLEMFVIFSLIFWLVEIVIHKRFREIWALFDHKIILLLFLFLGSGLISLFIARDQIAALGIFKAYLLEPALFFLLLLDLNTDSKFPEKIFYSLVSSGFIVSLIALCQKITGSNFYAPHEALQDRVTAVFNSANSLCLFLVPITLLLFSKIILILKNSQKDKKFFIFSLLFIFFLIIIFFTKSSGGMLAILITIPLIMVFDKLEPKFSKLKIKIFVPIIFLLLYFLPQILFFQFLLPSFAPQMSERPLVRVYSDTFTIRLCLWEGSWKIVKDHFITGIGLSSFPKVYLAYLTCDPEILQYPHNFLLSFWLEMGLLGVVSLFFMIFLWSKNLLGIKTKSFWPTALFAIIIYYLLHGLVDVPYFKNDLSLMWWIFFAMTFPLVKEKLDSKR